MRKRRTPRSSSNSSYGRARRRQRQWHARNAGFPGDVSPRAVFPSFVGMPELPGILAGMFQKDSGALIVVSGRACPRPVLLILHLALCSFLLSLALRCSAARPLWTRRTVLRVLLAVACARRVLLVFFTPRCVPLVVAKPMMFRIMAGMNQRGSFVATFWRTCLLFTTTGACGSDCSFTVDFPQLQSINSSTFPS